MTQNEGAAINKILAAQPWDVSRHRVSLLGIPHAGSGVSSLYALQQMSPPWVRTGIVRFTGRETRFLDGVVSDANTYLEEIARSAAALRGPGPLFLLGNCSGASLMLAAQRAIEDLGTSVAGFVAVSAPAPVAPAPVLPPGMTDTQFVDWLKTSWRIPPALFEDADMLDLLLPQLRADCEVLTALPSERTNTGRPFLVVFGENDENLGSPELRQWRDWGEEVTGATVPGGHFVAVERPESVWQAVSSFIEGVTATGGPAGTPTSAT
ncbi:thioesterase II family protein [Streptomyces sp. NPDC093097]|uniref:thioesterase II family protein n=1 Tax=Streptomyces sp. NPDC093097 TaxID=3366027 RepID=UPI0037F197F4